MEAKSHVSLQVFLHHFCSFSPVTLTCSENSFHYGNHCILMSYESSLESSCSHVQLIRTVHSDVLRHMLLGILVQPYSHVGSKPWHQSYSGPYLLHFLGMCKILYLVSKISKFFRQSSSSSCSFIGISCRLFSFTLISSQRITIITTAITIVMGCDES